MKIVLVSFLYEPEIGGGSSQVVYALAHSLAAHGEAVTVITSAAAGKKIVEHKDGIKIIRFSPRNLYWVNDKEKQPLYRKIAWQLFDTWNPYVFNAVKGFLEEEKPDLVHVHKLRGLSPSVWSSARASRVPVLVHSCHDYELVSPEGLFTGRVGQLAYKRALIMRPYQMFRAGLSKEVQLASGPSRFILDIHTRMGFFSKADCRVIPNSHGFRYDEIPGLRNPGKSNHQGGLKLVYLGRLAIQKGVDILCQAFMISLGQNPEITLDIAGWGPQEEYLRQKYANIPQIRFHGKVFGVQKAQLLTESDLLVLPSTAFESFGIVLVEAFAYGKPVLASRTGGIPEIILEGKNGFLVPPGDVEALSCKINEIASGEYDLASMRETILETSKQYTSEAILQNYLDLYSRSA